MKEMLIQLLIAVITAAVPVLTTFFVKYINQKKAELSAQTDSAKWQWYIDEIAGAITDAVSSTSQTYVDALKKAGTFDLEAQKEAARKALAAALAAISPAAQEFIEQMYGDISEYLSTRIEAEVRKQKIESSGVINLPVLESTGPDAETIAASTAAATVAAITQVNAAASSAE